ncbi:MAG: hypothetical protein ACRBDI_04370 [Alphaproteobacteria bacterium]
MTDNIEDDALQTPVNIYPDVLKTVPIEEIFLYVTQKTQDLEAFATQCDISEISLAKTMKHMGYYAESIPVKQIEFQLDGEIRRISGNDLSELRKLMGVQAYSLNVVYQYAMEKFAAQSAEDGAPLDTRYLHYALMAQSLFMKTVKVIQNEVHTEQKQIDSYSSYS